jgi:ABC-type phosphate/phosphonate transport system substrate-binding protein
MRMTKSAGNQIHMEVKTQDAKYLRLSVWIFMGALACAGALLFGQTKGPNTEMLNIGFTSSLFMDVNTADGLAATKVWTDAIVQKRSLDIVTTSMVFENLPELEKAIKEGKVDGVTLLTREYFVLEGKIPFEPYFVSQNRGKVNEECLLLVHNRSGIQNLEELAKKNILISETARASLGKIWLENVLMGKGYASLNAFFGKVSLIRKSSQVLLPVFFQQADACLINSDAFETTAELNPQLKRDLKIIARSPFGATSVICIRTSLKPALRQILVESLRDLHVEPKGQQILTLFKVEKLLPFEPSYLESARQLIQDHSKLEARVKSGRTDIKNSMFPY